jgi:iron-sulfur cluster assembly accessory protein
LAIALVGTARRAYIECMSETMDRFKISDSAAARIATIMAGEAGALALRVEVLAGGCNGFQYKFDLTGAIDAEDYLVERDGAKVVVDPASLDLLDGAELDYKDTLMGSYFAVGNPNAKTSCGCGTSFSVD